VASTAEDKATQKRELIEAVRASAKRNGKVPGVARFAREVGVGPHVFQGILWPSWAAFLAAADLRGGVMAQAVSDTDLLRHLAVLTRQYGQFPTAAQLKFAHTTSPEVPHIRTFRRHFPGMPEMLTALKQWTAALLEYRDVAALLVDAPRPGTGRRPRSRPINNVEAGFSPVLLSDCFVPPVIDCLPALASGDPEIERCGREVGVELSVELEKRTAIALRMLGLDVEILGQGAGRVADGIARCWSGRWAVVFDTKVRRDGFVMGTEDRKFRDYLERHGNDLEREGFRSIYFAVISSSFEEADVAKAREVVRLTKAKAFVLVEAVALRALVELRLRAPSFDMTTLERLFAASAVITMSDIKHLGG
jgi:hypothetical protein